MDDDIMAEEPSLAQAPAEMVHREHSRHHHAHLHHQHHLHNLHRRQGVDAVTEVTATVSVVQQINVDENGNTIAVSTVLAASPTVLAPTGLTVVDASGVPVDTSVGSDVSSSASPLPASNTPVSSTSSAPQSFTSDQTPLLTSTPSSTTAFATAGSNSTSLIISSSSLPANQTSSLLFSNSTLLSSSTTFSSSTSSTATLFTTSSSLLQATSQAGTTAGIGGAAGTSATSSATTTAGAGAAGGAATGSTTPSSGVIAGGVVGGVAGISIIVLLAFMLLRWKRGSSALLPLGDGRNSSNSRAVTEAPDAAPPSTPMAQQARSMPFAVPAALASLTGKRRSEQSRNSAAPSSTAGSERGFYRVSGRKITSVLESGGDGYSDSSPAARNTLSSTGGRTIDRDTFSDSSVYRDSRFYSTSPTSPVTLAGPLSAVTAGFTASSAATARDSGPVFSGPSPARTPIISQGPFAESTAESPNRLDDPPLALPLPMLGRPPGSRPDLVGRSHPSQDGSKSSRFHEDV